MTVGILAAALAAYAGSGTAGGKKPIGVPGSARGNAPGVSKTIRVAILMQLKDCGVNKAPGNISGTEERYTTYVKWFNQHIKFPGGRKLAVEFIDSGGPDPTCADVQRASVLKAIQQDHVFAILGPAGEGINPGLNVGDIAAKNHTINIGNSFQTFHDLKTHAPYFWELGEPTELDLQYLTDFIQKRVKSTQYTADNGSKHPRVWGMLWLDDTLNRVLANIDKRLMADIGIDVKQYFISPDLATAAQQASGIALQMQQAGVNSVIYGFTSIAFLSFNTAAANAGFHPDFYIYGNTSLPGLTIFVPYFGKEFIKRLYGVGPPLVEAEREEVDTSGDINPKSCPSCYGQVNNEQVAATQAYMQAGGSAGDHPEIGANGDTSFIWPSMATVAEGVANAGPVLNAYTFSWGLRNGPTASCMNEQFFGVQPYKQASDYTYRGRNYLTSGYTTLYFDPNTKTTYGSLGMFQSYDNYEKFESATDLPAKPTYDTGQHGGYTLDRQRSHINVDYNCQAQVGK